MLSPIVDTRVKPVRIIAALFLMFSRSNQVVSFVVVSLASGTAVAATCRLFNASWATSP